MSDISNPEVDQLRTPGPAQSPPPGPSFDNGSPLTGDRPSSAASTKDVAADEARGVAEDAKEGGRHVAETTKDQAGEVVDEARTQARELYGQAKDELAVHAADQHRRAGAGLHSLADELHGMVGRSAQGGVATDLTRQAAQQVSGLAGWFDSHEPGDALDELRSLARRRPGAFLAGAAVLGLIGGRLMRGGIDEARDDSPSTRPGTGSVDARSGAASFTTAPTAFDYRGSTASSYDDRSSTASSFDAAGSSFDDRGATGSSFDDRGATGSSFDDLGTAVSPSPVETGSGVRDDLAQQSEDTYDGTFEPGRERHS